MYLPDVEPSCSYRWRVWADSEQRWSEPAHFITGLAADDWQASWIGFAAVPRLRPNFTSVSAIIAAGAEQPFADLGESFYRLSFMVENINDVSWAQLRVLVEIKAKYSVMAGAYDIMPTGWALTILTWRII